MPDLGDGGELLMLEIGMLAGALLQDAARAEVAADGREIARREEQRRLRNELLARLGGQRTFSAGVALVAGPGGQTEGRAAIAIVTEDELVLLDADAEEAPEELLARIPRQEIVAVRLLDEFGDPVATHDTDPLIELDAPARRFVVWVDRRRTDGSGGGHPFVFRAGSVAREAADRFDEARIGGSSQAP